MSTKHNSLPLRKWNFRSFLTISQTITARFLRNMVKWLTPTRPSNPQHYGSDPADIRIRIRINLEIRDSNPGLLSVGISNLEDFAVYELSCFNIRNLTTWRLACSCRVKPATAVYAARYSLYALGYLRISPTHSAVFTPYIYNSFLSDLQCSRLINNPPKSLGSFLIAYNTTLSSLLDKHAPVIIKFSSHKFYFSCL